ncbi:MAG: selenide, water dikinase SelD [Haloarculaceae archaeon]
MTDETGGPADETGDPTDETGGPRLTDYAELHGCSCKVGRADLEALLAEADLGSGFGGEGLDDHQLLAGVGEDAAARQITDDLALVQTVDFFTPIVDDPYDFGRVAAANACSDAFATGAFDDLSLLVVLGMPRAVTEHAPAILAGMQDVLAEVDGVLAGGHTTLNPWPMAGGAVTATAPPDDLLTSRDAEPGDRLLLTKPLGTQPAMGALRVRDGEFGDTVAGATGPSIEAIGNAALSWMTTPNLAAARAARPYATAATDVTGFGLLGQARTLAARSGVRVVIDRLPVVEGTPALSRLFGYGLAEGESAETSGGLLISVPGERLPALRDALAAEDVFHREVGRVVAGEGASLADPTVDEVPM